MRLTYFAAGVIFVLLLRIGWELMKKRGPRKLKKELREVEQRERRDEKQIKADEKRIKDLEGRKNVAVSSKLTLGGTTMPLTVKQTDAPGTAVYQEFDAQGGKVSATGTVAYASDNSAVATVDASSGQLAYVGAGTANISASDGGNLPASDVLTVLAVAVSSTLTLNAGA